MGKRWRNLVSAALLTVLGALTIFTVTVVSQTQISGSVKIDGSSTVYPITEAVAEEFQKRYPRVKVTIGISGTGGGFKKFARGETDINNASRPVKSSEDEECRKNGIAYIELPVAYDALAVVVNPANNWCEHLTVDELKKIWEPDAQGKITNWSQIRQGFPNRPLKLFGPGTDSGTFEYFTEAIVGKAGASRGDYTASEDDNVLVHGVASDPNALGYFGLAYYVENSKRLKAVAIQHPDYNGGKPCLPSEKTVLEGRYYLARPLFIYVNRESAERPEVRAFVEFYLQNAAKLVKEVGYVPLPKRAYDLAMERFKKRIAGSMFGAKGAQVGVSIQELLELEAKKTK
ncbi:MAG: PstS family phosphate ABC transporter substrate-binding protein [Armatimonadetes bacterium]|nr:PstS family phosphate ABC transporter substrate-binding protein [Armatimonadota bacterium]MCX7967398.1 PstS family phosphate ABC transporter substrate-binding protein [Armatimonadota bacterium]MDW8142631.1 PstS family phosphate ABC transporter substrate-binding protein [Armatimonadota bacterium]